MDLPNFVEGEEIMKKYSILKIAVISFLPFMLSEADTVTYNPPMIDGSRVDGCTLEDGEANCSNWGEKQAADAFCRKKGHKKAISVRWHHYGDEDIGTYRYKIYTQNGQKRSTWEYCAHCSAAQTKVICEKKECSYIIQSYYNFTIVNRTGVQVKYSIRGNDYFLLPNAYRPHKLVKTYRGQDCNIYTKREPHIIFNRSLQPGFQQGNQPSGNNTTWWFKQANNGVIILDSEDCHGLFCN